MSKSTAKATTTQKQSQPREFSDQERMLVKFMAVAIAADQLNRTCYGMEISPKYCHVIIKRFKAYCEKAGKDCAIKANGEVLSQ